MKATTGLIAQVPGGETLVLQAVRDLLGELRLTRRRNASLSKEVERLKARLARVEARKATAR